MTFDFERPNFPPSVANFSTASNILDGMQQVNNQPPVYDGRSLDEVQNFANFEKLDKLDALYVAQKEYNESMSKYASSSTHQNFVSKLKH